MAEEGGRAFFRIVVEGLGDRFEPRLCDEYARLFAEHRNRKAGMP